MIPFIESELLINFVSKFNFCSDSNGRLELVLILDEGERKKFGEGENVTVLCFLSFWCGFGSFRSSHQKGPKVVFHRLNNMIYMDGTSIYAQFEKLSKTEKEL